MWTLIVGFSVYFCNAYFYMVSISLMWEVVLVQRKKLFTLLLVCKSWFKMVTNACMIIYIVYTRYFVLWVFALFISDFDCLIHILNVSFKISAGQPTKKWFYTCFKCFENRNYFKIYQTSCFIKWHFCHYLGVWGMTHLIYSNVFLIEGFIFVFISFFLIYLFCLLIKLKKSK